MPIIMTITLDISIVEASTYENKKIPVYDSNTGTYIGFALPKQ